LCRESWKCFRTTRLLWHRWRHQFPHRQHPFCWLVCLSKTPIPNGEVRTTTLTIAEGTDFKHHAVIQLVRKYQCDLEAFGNAAFEMRLNTQGSPTEIAQLNEHQATLIMTYLRNSEIVRAFKIGLVNMQCCFRCHQMDRWRRSAVKLRCVIRFSHAVSGDHGRSRIISSVVGPEVQRVASSAAPAGQDIISVPW